MRQQGKPSNRSDDFDFQDKLNVLLNDGLIRKDTFATRAAAEADNIRGRFAAHEKATVTGADPSVEYPRLPASSPWSDRLADEPTFDATDCGTAFGIALGEPHEQPLGDVQSFSAAVAGGGTISDLEVPPTPSDSDAPLASSSGGAGADSRTSPSLSPPSTFRKRQF